MSTVPDRANGRLTLSVLLIGLGLASSDCGELPTEAGTARLTILLTDAQAGLEEAWVEITGIYLQGRSGESDEQVWLYGGGATASSVGMIDLLTLTDATVTMADELTVPAGVFGQLRIIVGDAVVKTAEGKVYATEGAAHPDGLPIDGPLFCPSCSQTGFKVLMPGGALKLENEAKILLVDFDVAQSFGHAAGSHAWVMHPVLLGSDFLASGTISGTVSAAAADLAGCGVDMTTFIPIASDGDLQLSGEVNGDGSYAISFVPPGTYTLGYADPVETASSSVQFQASADPATVTVGPGGTANADYTITSCDAGGSSGGGGSLTWASLALPLTGPTHRLSTAFSESDYAVFACEFFGDYKPARVWKFDLTSERWVIVVAVGWPTGKYRKCVLDPVERRLMTYWDGLGWVYALSTSGGYWLKQGRNDTNSDEYYEGAPFFDPAARQLSHFAGHGLGTFKNDLKTFDRTTLEWTDVAQTDPPDGRLGPPRALDVAGARAFFAGRNRGTEGVADDLWVLDLRSYDWSELIPAGAPNALDRFDSGMAYVPSENALYRFGGTELPSGAPNAELVRLDLDASTLEYTVVPTEGPAPGGRAAAELHYDRIGHRLILVGGRDGTGDLSEVWALDLRG